MNILYFVGKPYPHRSILERFRSLGYDLGVFYDPASKLVNEDVFTQIIPLDFSSEERLLASLTRVSSEAQPSGLLCTYENYIRSRTIIANYFRLPTMSSDSAVACTDKYIMRKKIQAYDSTITPCFINATSLSDCLDFANTHGYPVVLKPTGLVKSLLVSVCSSPKELSDTYSRTKELLHTIYAEYNVKDRAPALILEQFIDGNMCSVAGFVNKNGIPYLCDGIVELTTAQQVGFNDNFLYSRKLTGDISASTKERILTTATSGIRALGISSSPVHVEIIYNDTSTKIVEIGARTGGYRPFMYSESYGINTFEQEALLALGRNPALKGSFHRYTAMYEIFAKTAGLLKEFLNLDHTHDYAYIHDTIRPGCKTGTASAGFKAPLIIGISEASRERFNTLCQRVEKVEVITE